MDSFIEPRQVAERPEPATSRRHFITAFDAVATLGSIGLLSSCGSDESPIAAPTPTSTGTPAPAPSITTVTDTDLLVLMQQLHYLQAEFYSRAVLGVPLAASLVTGAGTLGTVTGGTAVAIADPVLADMLREIAAEKIDQVVRLRAVLGTSNPARPDVNIGVDAAGVFTDYGVRAADDLNQVPASTYNVYANQDQLLLGGFLLEDAVLTAWRGVAPLMTSNVSIETVAAMMATSAFHTGLIRNQLFIRGATLTTAGTTRFSLLRRASLRLSDVRDGFSPAVDDDRGVAANSQANAAADVNPADGEGEVYGRQPQLTVNTFYMTRAAATGGGFFPSGLNGTIRTSAAI